MRVGAGLLCILLASARLHSQESDSPGTSSSNRGGVTIILPAGDLYEPALADPREPRFHQAVVQITGGSVASLVWLTDHGETIGLVRWTRRQDRAMQVGIFVAKFAQFDLFTESNDLVNADYTIGIPLSFRRGTVTGRASVYHVSSHLGDEYLVRTGSARVNVSYETLDLRLAQDRGGMRLYGGGEVALRRSPSDLVAASARLGAEARWMAMAFDVSASARAYPVMAIDLAVPSARGGGVRASAKGGFELATRRSHASGGRRMALLGEYFSGRSQFGQFYRDRIRYAGLAVQVTM